MRKGVPSRIKVETSLVVYFGPLFDISKQCLLLDVCVSIGSARFAKW